VLQRALADVVPGKGGRGARPWWTDGAPAPLAGGLHNPFSVKRQGRNAGHIAAAGAVGAVERPMTPTMAVPSCRSSRGFQNRPSSAGPIILTPHLLLPSSFGLPFCVLLVDSVPRTIFGKISETYISEDLHSFWPAPTKTHLPMLTQQQRRRSAPDTSNPQVKSALCPLCPQHQAAERPLYFRLGFGLTRNAVLGSPLKIRL
jgi:hypothetical protein